MITSTPLPITPTPPVSATALAAVYQRGRTFRTRMAITLAGLQRVESGGMTAYLGRAIPLPAGTVITCNGVWAGRFDDGAGALRWSDAQGRAFVVDGKPVHDAELSGEDTISRQGHPRAGLLEPVPATTDA